MNGAGGVTSITEWLANLSTVTVIIIMAVLILLRFALVRFGSSFARSAAEIAESLAIALGLVFLIIRPFFVQAFFIPSESMVPTLLISDHILVNKTVYLMRDPNYKDVVVFNAPPEALEMRGPIKDVPTGQTQYIKRCIGVPGDEIYITGGYVSVGSERWSHNDLYTNSQFKDRFYSGELVGKDGAFQSPNPSIKIKTDGVYVDGERVSDQDLADILGATEKIEYHPGTVYVNGKALDESYTREDPAYPYPVPDPSDPLASEMTRNIEKAVARGDIKLIKKGGHDQVKLGKGQYLMMGDNRNNSSDGRYWGPLDRSKVIGRAMFIFWKPGRFSWVR